MGPLGQIARGLAAYPRGLAWLGRHPRYLVMLFFPLGIGIVSLVTFGVLLWHYRDPVMAHLLFAPPDHGWKIALYHFCRWVLYLMFLLSCFVASFLVMNIIAAPIYDVVSTAIERERFDGKAARLGFWRALGLMGEEIKKALMILTISVVFMVLPGMGLLGLAGSAFMLGWDFYDYPLSRRGWRLSERLRFARADFWAVFGMGLWLAIPFVQIFTVPLAVAGATLLNLDQLEKTGRCRG